jgi:DNA-binding NtrC family response regulator
VLLEEFGGANAPTLDAEVRDLFRRHPWPGNLRQLSYLLRTAMVMAEGNPAISREHLPDDFIEDVEQGLLSIEPSEMAPESKAAFAVAPPAPAFAPPAQAAEHVTGRLKDLALLAIRDAIARSGGNISAAARELGVSRSTLYRKLHDRPPV